MKQLSEALASHIEGDVTLLCRCWIVETVAGDRLGFTDHDRDLEVDGTLCEADAGAEPGSVDERIGLNIDSTDIAGALQSSRITEADIREGRFDGGRVTSWLVNWRDPAQRVVDRVYFIGEIHREDGHFRFELLGQTSLLDQTRGRYFARACQADLGDARCRVDIAAPQFRGTGTVTAIRSQLVIEAGGLDGHGDGWFAGGRLSWTTGSNTGLAVEVATFTVDTQSAQIQLWHPMPRDIAPGDTFGITAGCDKSFATCRGRFSNSVNFQGFPHMPGDGFALSHAANSSRLDGGVIVP